MRFYYVADVSLTGSAAIPFSVYAEKKKDKWDKTVPGSENPISTIFRYKFLINLTVDMTQILSLFTISVTTCSVIELEVRVLKYGPFDFMVSLCAYIRERYALA